MVRRIDGRPVKQDAPFGFVAYAVQRHDVMRRQDRGHDHFIAGQGAGLVSADDGHGAYRFNGGQAPHDGVAPGHRLYANGKRNGQHRRQAFRYGRNGQADHRHEQLGEFVAMDEVALHQQQRRNAKYHGGEPPAEAIHLFDQGRGQGLNRR
ncbi:hypothetical protein D3C85_602890 [compost metagenome]